MVDAVTPPAADPAAAPATPAAAVLYPDPAAVSDPAPADGGEGGEAGGAAASPPDPAADPAEPAEPAASDPPAEPDGDPDPAPEPAPLTIESYKDLSIPEGLTVAEPSLTALKTIALENNLTPEVAQNLLTMHTDALKAQREADQTAFTEVQTQWTNEINALPEFTGAKRETSLAAIGRVLDEYGSPEVRALLDSTGAGNNPALAKMFLSLGNALSEGRATPTGSPGGGAKSPKTPGESLYPNTQQ